MKTINPMIRLALIVTLCSPVGHTNARMDSDFELWKKQQQQAFQTFKDDRDLAFAEFLKRQWQEMQLMQGIIPDETPKPTDTPVYTPPTDAPPEGEPDSDKEPAPAPQQTPSITPMPQPEAGSPLEPEPDELPSMPEPETSQRTLQLNFFDTSVTVSHQVGLNPPFGKSVNKEAISDFWEAMSRTNPANFLRQVRNYKQQMALNDWGYCLLLYRIGEQLYPEQRNAALLFVWFMLLKSGYAARAGYDANQIYLMLPSVNTVYDTPYVTVGNSGDRFYAVSLDGQPKRAAQSIYTYEGNYPGADRRIDFNIEQAPKLGNRAVHKTFRFNYKGKDIAFGVNVNQSLLDFFKNFPATDLSIRFRATLSIEAQLSLFEALKPLLDGVSKREALNLLLRFVQTAFSYETDQEQFGQEKALFPEETLGYEASDCEDRAVLFSFLVRKLLNLKVIGLDFPGHIATGVKLEADTPGDAVVYEGERYLICDPTYINATCGVCMPQYKTINPAVIQTEAKTGTLKESNR